MPNFKKSTGYKMKGSTFYGYGSSSPAKVTLSEVRSSVAGLSPEGESLKFKKKGYVTAVDAAQKQIKKSALDVARARMGEEEEINDNVVSVDETDNAELTNEEKGKAKGKDRKGYIVPKKEK